MPSNRSSVPISESKIHRVALVVETSLASGRDILLGIARYVRGHRPWLLYHQARGLEDEVPPWLASWKGDGIIARVQTPAMAEALQKTNLPVVDVLGVIPDAHFPLIHSDDRAIGMMAAEHLLDLGLRHYAYLGIEGENWSTAREAAFVGFLQSKGFKTNVRLEKRHDVDLRSWEEHQANLADWISRLPRPAGIMVCSDQRASPLLDACRRARLNVPDDIAVIGVDNDEPLCGVCNPSLTSIWPNHEQIGYEAAVLLQKLMNKEQDPPNRTFLPPKFVVTRTSTDTLAVDDEVVAAALRMIRKFACQRIGVDDIAAVVGVSRSVLQRRFRAVLRHTINEELVSRRLKVASDLLRETRLPLIEVAERAGFQHQEYMGAVFKAHLGTTPAVYRRQMQKP